MTLTSRPSEMLHPTDGGHPRPLGPRPVCTGRPHTCARARTHTGPRPGGRGLCPLRSTLTRRPSGGQVLPDFWAAIRVLAPPTKQAANLLSLPSPREHRACRRGPLSRRRGTWAAEVARALAAPPGAGGSSPHKPQARGSGSHARGGLSTGLVLGHSPSPRIPGATIEPPPPRRAGMWAAGPASPTCPTAQD